MRPSASISSEQGLYHARSNTIPARLFRKRSLFRESQTTRLMMDLYVIAIRNYIFLVYSPIPFKLMLWLKLLVFSQFTKNFSSPCNYIKLIVIFHRPGGRLHLHAARRIINQKPSIYSDDRDFPRADQTEQDWAWRKRGSRPTANFRPTALEGPWAVIRGDRTG